MPAVTRETASKPAYRIAGAISVVFGMLSLCGGALRLIHPESGVSVEIFEPVFADSGIRGIVYGSLTAWMVLSFLLIAAGVALTAGMKIGRVLGLIWASASVLVSMVVMVLFAVWVVPALTEQSLETGDMVRLAVGAPATGCCPTVWAIVMLAILAASTDGEPGKAA